MLILYTLVVKNEASFSVKNPKKKKTLDKNPIFFQSPKLETSKKYFLIHSKKF